MTSMASLAALANPGATSSLAERLEQGEIITWAGVPWTLPAANDHQFLLAQRESGWPHKNISFNPMSGKLKGFVYESAPQAEHLQHLLSDFGQQAASWLGQVLPRYAAGWRRDRVCLRLAEEATRRARLTDRNDLLHVDAMPSRPTQGYRILRLFVNLHPVDPRVWVTSESFSRLLERFRAQVGLPGAADVGWRQRWRQGLVGLFQPARKHRTLYDQFMRRFHHFLKANEEFQERSPRRVWHFPPGALWLAFTDSISHADLRGSALLEQTFFVAPPSLALPAEAPAAVLERACGLPVLGLAA